ncbi:MAG: amidohydrolase [Proteobacteria bacterium]|nr:amidohydrolase [Pseudomonadota bacterium]MBU1583376.1 amidohydrolase [Pseudomonadota bacterium]MBU2455981.1 amidohydrolase [Pseudomonadota bacterium]MBU2629622.1 amidohydrolase [Pseudomonadota bacterium]
MLHTDLPSFNDAEGSFIPDGLPTVIDSHVHIFPGKIFSSVWSWFDQYAWKIRYQMDTSLLINYLLDHGVSHVVALQYAHKPGISEGLNAYMVKKCNEFKGRVTGMATVFPGEPSADQILLKAFSDGLKGVKLHAHVQCFDMNSPDMDVIYDICEKENKPMVMHVGREPKSEEYACDPYAICRADKLEAVLNNFPKLNICVPHLGFDEIAAYKDLIEKYDTLWLDTAMVLTDYFPYDNRIGLENYRIDRIMYGSDFPNIPYAWDRELMWLKNALFSFEDLEQILYKSAARFFNLSQAV